MTGETSQVVHIPCPACHSTQTYYRRKADDQACKSCGHTFKREAPLLDLSGLSDHVREGSPEE